MNPSNSKRIETLIYAGLWFIAIVLFLLDIMRGRSYTNMPLLDIEAVGRLTLMLLPFISLFALNNYLFIPKLLKKGHYTRYFFVTLCVIGIIWLWQRLQFYHILSFEEIPGHGTPPPHHGPHPLIPLPLFLDVIYDLLIVGVNLVISLLFQQFADRLTHESLMKENAENQLAYLKAQINPHFYMNMLNNIHGMIEIDSLKAQDMVIEMSRLMRYMLYNSSQPEIAMSAEVGFIKDYLALMRVRFPEDSVNISVKLPDNSDTHGIYIPPLLFLVFLENAFKHGVSYSSDSFIFVNLNRENNKIIFQCMNSIHKGKTSETHAGIGLENVRRRLEIIYGNHYNLDIEKTDSVYTVTLTLPYHEIENADN